MFLFCHKYEICLCRLRMNLFVHTGKKFIPRIPQPPRVDIRHHHENRVHIFRLCSLVDVVLIHNVGEVPIKGKEVEYQIDTPGIPQTVRSLHPLKFCRVQPNQLFWNVRWSWMPLIPPPLSASSPLPRLRWCYLLPPWPRRASTRQLAIHTPLQWCYPHLPVTIPSSLIPSSLQIPPYALT